MDKIYKVLFYLIRIFLLLFILGQFLSLKTYSQQWPKMYYQSTNTWCNNLIEYYDNGYIILGQVDPGNSTPTMYCWLIKTDVNGAIIWEKKVLSNDYNIAMNGIDNTQDGGLILCGVTSRTDPNFWDIVFEKLNACGAKEWCNIVSFPYNDDYGIRIKSIPGGYIALIKYFEDLTSKRIWLFKLDLLGNIVWEKLYAQSDTNIFNEEGEDLTITSDGGYLITGDCYYLVPNGTYGLIRPLLIKADSNGNESWVLPFGVDIGYLGDYGGNSYEDQFHNYYTADRHRRQTNPLGDSPGFIKVNQYGEELYYKDLFDNTTFGASYTLKTLNTNRMIISSSWTYSTNGLTDTVGLIKCDTLGNILKTKIILVNGTSNLVASAKTFDGNMITSGGFSNSNPYHAKIYLYKVDTTDLEYAVLNTNPYIYDSLCSHTISSDTMNLDDCGVITDVQDPVMHPEKYNLVIYPNPAIDNITIDMPQYLLRKSSSRTIQITTIYHQWNTTTLEIYDLFGTLMYSREIPKKTEKVELDVSSWHEGMYVARVVFMNEVVDGAKFVVQ